MSKPIDCHVIGGDVLVIISRSTAEAALDAMRRIGKQGAYAKLMADDASFIRANLEELRRASGEAETVESE